jgi:hypothetical protein
VRIQNTLFGHRVNRTDIALIVETDGERGAEAQR